MELQAKQAQSNDTNSTMKNYLDNWYKNNLNSYTDKISKDTIFCNNRTTSKNKWNIIMQDMEWIQQCMVMKDILNMHHKENSDQI